MEIKKWHIISAIKGYYRAGASFENISVLTGLSLIEVKEIIAKL